MGGDLEKVCPESFHSRSESIQHGPAAAGAEQPAQKRTTRGSPMGEGRSLVGNKNSDSESDDVEAVEERPWRQLLWHKGRDPCVVAPE